MAVTLTIASGKTNVAMPNGGLYNAGDVVVLTDAQYAQIPAKNYFGGSAALFTAAVAVAAGTDGVAVQGAAVTAPAALTAAPAAAATPTKAEHDAVVTDLGALRTTVATIRTNLTGIGKALAS